MGELVRTTCKVTPGCEYYAGHGGGCGGAIEPLGKQWEAAMIADATIQQLREENARLKSDLQHLATATQRTIDDFAKDKVNAANAENQRLKMELADERRLKDFCAAKKLEVQVELEFCKREITRLDPRLAAARWGKRATGMAGDPPTAPTYPLPFWQRCPRCGR